MFIELNLNILLIGFIVLGNIKLWLKEKKKKK